MVQILLEHGIDKMIVNSAADWGVSDPLMVPKTVARMREAGFDEAQIDQLVWGNPTSFFAQGGRLDPDSIGELLPVDRRQTFTGNSILRGQDPNAR
jgi:hypothetical protein